MSKTILIIALIVLIACGTTAIAFLSLPLVDAIGCLTGMAAVIFLLQAESENE